MPIEYGGIIPIKDIITDIKGKLLSYREEILANDDFLINDIKFSKPDYACEPCGSFRKLEID